MSPYVTRGYYYSKSYYYCKLMYRVLNHVRKIENQSAEKYKHLRHIYNSFIVWVERVRVILQWSPFGIYLIIQVCGKMYGWLEFGEYNNDNYNSICYHLCTPSVPELSIHYL